MTKQAIDISKHDGTIDFGKVKESGIDTVIIRAGYGKLISQKDIKFEEYYRLARQYGFNIGVYWYSYAVTKSDALKEAETCLNVIRGKQFELPVFFDIEETCCKEQAKDLVETFCSTVEKAGYYVGIYASKCFVLENLSNDNLRKYDLWLAHYTTKTDYKGNYGIWQYSSTGHVNGIKGDVDLDIVYKDYPTIIKQLGLNGFEKQDVKPVISEPSAIDDMLLDIELLINGKQVYHVKYNSGDDDDSKIV